MNTAIKLTGTAPVCLWAQAGVIKKKDCLQDFQCNLCRFDRILRRVCRENREKREKGENAGGAKGSILFWKDRLRQLPPSRRPCIHHMKGHLEFRLCHRDYNCAQCEFDEYFYDLHTVYVVVRPVVLRSISGVQLPRGYYLHEGHTWAKLENDNRVRVGLDDFARRVLGPPDRIDVPLVGKTLVRGRADITLYRGNRRAAFVSPVGGVVTAVNTERLKGGACGKDTVYADDWLLIVHSDTIRRDLTALLFMDEAEKFMASEVQDLYRVMEKQTGLMAADGGMLGEDIAGPNPENRLWETFVNRFFRKAP